MTILVTGGCGFLGSAITRQLLARGMSVRTFDCRSWPTSIASHEHIVGDINDPAALNRAVAGVEAIIHTVALIDLRWWRGRVVRYVNEAGTRHLLAAAQANNVRRFIFTSTMDVVLPPLAADGSDPHFRTSYARSKGAAESLVLSLNDRAFQTTVLRLAHVWGPGDPYGIPPLQRLAEQGQLVCLGNGTAREPMIYVDNAADAHLFALDNLDQLAGKVWHATDGRENYFTFTASLLAQAGYQFTMRFIPLWLARTVGFVGEAAGLTLNRHAVRATTQEYAFPPTLNDTGWQPPISRDAMITQTVHSLRRVTTAPG